MSRLAFVLCLCLLALAAGCVPPPTEQPPSPTPEGPTAEPSPTPTPTSTAPTPTPSLSPVAILVLDDFQPADQPRQGRPPTTGNCPVTPDGQGGFSGGGLGGFSGGGLAHLSDDELALYANTPHGELVYGRLRQLIETDYGAPTREIADADFRNYDDDLRAVTIWSAEGEDLILVGVDTNGFDTTRLAEITTEAMTTVTAQWGARRFVLNMSFGLIPCNEGADLTAEEYRALIEGDVSALTGGEASSVEPEMPLESLRELLDQLDQLVAEEAIDQETADSILIGRARMFFFYQQGAEEVFPITTGQGEDALFQLTQRLSEQPESEAAADAVLGSLPAAAIIVAAAGNSNLSFPFAPAMWPGVLAVGAGPAYSNDSEVLMHDTYTLPDTDITVSGTSFAAPEMSFLAAVHLLRGGSADCAGATGSKNPPLSYTDVTGPWLNLDLLTAATQYCGTFPLP